MSGLPAHGRGRLSQDNLSNPPQYELVDGCAIPGVFSRGTWVPIPYKHVVTAAEATAQVATICVEPNEALVPLALIHDNDDVTGGYRFKDASVNGDSIFAKGVKGRTDQVRMTANPLRYNYESVRSGTNPWVRQAPRIGKQNPLSIECDLPGVPVADEVIEGTLWCRVPLSED